MKFTYIKLLMLIFAVTSILSPRDASSQTPTYRLLLTNDAQIDDKNYEFDLFLQSTGTSFEYANNSQFFININPVVKNGGALTFSIVTGTCGLNSFQQISPTKVSYDNVNNRLRVASHSPSGPGTGTMISITAPGTKLGRFRVTNTAVFSALSAGLNWYNGPSGFFTKVFAYISGANVEITNASSHLINLVDPALPVALLEFDYSAGKNNVTIHWKTGSEVNNSGFRIERMKVSENKWEDIGFVTGHGTTNQAQSYSYEDKKLAAAKYKYRLKQTDYSGGYEYHTLNREVDISKPGSFGISQNYPNPSNPKSRIDYELPFDGKVTIKVYDLIGREAAVLVNDTKEAGYYSAEFDGSNLSSGVYFYRIIAEGSGEKFTKTLKMVLVK